MLYPSVNENPAKTVLFKIVIPIVLSFIAGSGLTYLAFFSKTSSLQSSISNEESQLPVEEVISESEQPSTQVYRNSVYGITFMYPGESYVQVTENKFSEFGNEIGTTVPYEEIIMAKDGNVSIAIWNISKLPEFKKQNPSMQLIDQPTFSLPELESLPLTQNQYYFIYDEFFIYISIDATRVKQSQLGELFVKSFRTFDTTKSPDFEFWRELPSKNFTIRYPLDWSAKSQEGLVTVYSVSEWEKNEPPTVREFGINAHEVLSLSYTEQSVDDWISSRFDANEQFIQKHLQEERGQNILHTYTICNRGGEYFKGTTLRRGTMCSEFSAITSSNSKGVISVIGKENKIKVDPYVDVVLGTIVFN